jgi:hypothetical protein
MTDDLSPYVVVVNGWAYAFAHRDSYLRFLDEMKKIGQEIGSHQGGILNSCDEGLDLYKRLCEGDAIAREIEADSACKRCQCDDCVNMFCEREHCETCLELAHPIPFHDCLFLIARC